MGRKACVIFGGTSIEHDPSVGMFEYFVQKKSLDDEKFTCLDYFYLDKYGSVLFFSNPESFFFVDSKLKYGENKISRIEMISKIIEGDYFVFSLLQGSDGEDGMIQGVTKFFSIDSNCGELSPSCMSFDKYVFSLVANEVCNKELTPIPSYLFKKKSDIKMIEHLIYETGSKDFIVKPNKKGWSYLVASTTTHNSRFILDCCRNIIDADDDILVQEYIAGQEVTCGCIYVKEAWIPTECFEMISSSGIMGSDEKFGSSTYERAIFRDKYTVDLISNICVKLADWFEFDTQCRFDFKVLDKKIYLIECNSKPGLLGNSVYVEMLSKMNLDVNDLMKMSHDN